MGDRRVARPLAWIHPHQASEQTDALLRRLKEGVTVLVPSLWFLELALREHVPLGTKDTALQQAARQAGVDLLTG